MRNTVVACLTASLLLHSHHHGHHVECFSSISFTSSFSQRANSARWLEGTTQRRQQNCHDHHHHCSSSSPSSLKKRCHHHHHASPHHQRGCMQMHDRDGGEEKKKKKELLKKQQQQIQPPQQQQFYRKSSFFPLKAFSTAGYRDLATTAYKKPTAFTFSYSDVATRRKVSERRGQEYTGPPLKILVIGKPCSGKGTLAPMLSRAYRGVYACTGNLLRAEVKAETELGQIAQKQMAGGEMLATELILSLVRRRLGAKDSMANGWVLDGFPRTKEQAEMMLANGLVPDVILVLERPDELVLEFCLGRMTDSATGIIFHPKFNPPPEEVIGRLVWRLDDTEDVITKRLQQYYDTKDDVMEVLQGIPVHYINTARSDIESFEETTLILDQIAKDKSAKMGGIEAVAAARQAMIDVRQDDITVAPPPRRPVGLGLGQEDRGHVIGDIAQGSLLDAVEACNQHDIRNYCNVYVQDQQVGYIDRGFMNELRSYEGSAVEIAVDERGAGGQLKVTLAPYASSVEEKTTVLKGLVESLVASGAISSRAIRGEMQDVQSMRRVSFKDAALVRLERGAMIYFGVPSYGVHINGFYKDKDGTVHMWFARRSMSKPTYPGLWDQMVAGGQPSGMSLAENVVKECEEEASVSRSMIENNIKPVSLVSYRYATDKGLSTKFLYVYDLEVEPSFVPFNGDGEVDDFFTMTIKEALESIETKLNKWKPNCALVVVDFALRHGYVNPDHPDYMQICHMLRAGGKTFT